MSHLWLVKAKKTSLLVTVFLLSIALLASCSGGTDQGSKGFNKEEASTSDSKDRNEGEATGSSEEATSSADSKDQSRGEATGSSEEVALASGSEDRDERDGGSSNDKGKSPNYPDPPPQPAFTPFAGPQAGHGWYHPDVDGDGAGSGHFVEYQIDQQPPGWVDYSYVRWDNCPETPNPNQEDSDNDGWGDFCDPEPFIPYNPNQTR